MCEVLNKRSGRTDGVYVGRPSKWGNPFVVGRDGSREEVVRKYSEWLFRNVELLGQVHELRGKNIVCWCAPHACHADVLLELANEYDEQVAPWEGGE